MANLKRESLVRMLTLILVVAVLLTLLAVLVIVSKEYVNEQNYNFVESVEVGRTSTLSPPVPVPVPVQVQTTSSITVTKDSFGVLKNGTPVDRYTISNNNGTKVQIITYGSIITSMTVPDRRGQPTEITLGFDDIQSYEDKNVPYFGALVGRVANRISRGRFSLDNVTYQLNINDGDNHLHGGPRGWSKMMWRAQTVEDGVLMSLLSEDSDENYPGEVTATVTYRLTNDNELIVSFQATNKKKATPINLTTHPYFNLAGEGTSHINEHNITIFSDYYLKSSRDLIPTGEIAPVRGTLLDLRQSTRLGDVLPLFNGSWGYDHTFSVRGTSGKRLAARVNHPESGRILEVYTDQPGIQFYTGNFLDVKNAGRKGHSYPKHSGFCLETHNYPDSVNHENFPDSILREGSTYDHWTWYAFSVHN